MIECKKGEYVYIPSGIWEVTSGIMTKIGTNNCDEYVYINVCVPGDYIMPDLGIKVLALTNSSLVPVSISDIDTVKLFHQINDLERLALIRTHSLNPPVPGDGIYLGRIAKFLAWLSSRTGLGDKEIFSLFSQKSIGSFVGIKRCAVSSRLSAMGYSISPQKTKR
jgi:hypothetical protein